MRYHNFICAIIFSTLCGNVMAGSVEDKWGAPLKGPFGLKRVIVSVLNMKGQPDFEDQKLKVNKPTAEFMEDIDVATLLYTFDSLSSTRDIEDLASLTPYYLGEANGVLYRCLILRKGKTILPALKKLAATPSNECTDRFGVQAKICSSDKEYRDTLNYYVGTIARLTKTHSTEAGCTTADWAKM